jgi:hypothetical protein
MDTNHAYMSKHLYWGIQARTRLRAETLQRAGTSHVISYQDYVGYFLSPLDFLRHLLTSFLFRAAFKRFVLPRFFIFPPFPFLR